MIVCELEDLAELEHWVEERPYILVVWRRGTAPAQVEKARSCEVFSSESALQVLNTTKYSQWQHRSAHHS